MTAPIPVADLLDRLEQLRAAATPGPWAATDPRADGGAYIDTPVRHWDDGRSPWVGHAVRDADAALIVAAVNALPGLTAALRNVLARIENLEISAPDSSYRTVAALLRSDLYTALVPGRDGQQR